MGLRRETQRDKETQVRRSLKHHNAASDAMACAKIVLEALKKGIPARAFLSSKADTGGLKPVFKC